MPFDILEDGDFAGVRCSGCHKVMASQFTGLIGLRNGMHISEDAFYKIQKHAKTCKRTKPRSTKVVKLKDARL